MVELEKEKNKQTIANSKGELRKKIKAILSGPSADEGFLYLAVSFEPGQGEAITHQSKIPHY
jgi:hypothetical protein